MAEQSRRKRRVLLGALYGLFTLAVYVAATLWLFPYPELSRYLEARLRPLGVEFRVDGLGPGLLPGLRARQVQVASAADPTRVLQLTDVRLTTPLSRWIRGEAAVELDADTLGGRIETLYRQRARPLVEATWEGIDLAKAPKPPELAEFPVTGNASGHVEAEADLENPERLTGQIEATIQGVRLGPGKLRGFPVPEINLGNGTFRVSSQSGKVEIENAAFDGGDLGVDLRGNVLLRQDISRSLINGLLSLKPDEKASKDLALVFAVFPGSRSSDGRYTGRLRGTLGEPRLLKR